jgi:hypothetical protein
VLVAAPEILITFILGIRIRCLEFPNKNIPRERCVQNKTKTVQIININRLKKITIIGLILTITISAFSQINTKNISFELRYPIPIGDNFINKGFDNGYIGVIDLGVDYNIIKTNGLGIGLLLNSSVLRLSETDLTLMILSPKLKLEYEIDLNKVSIIPQVGVGYSNWRFRAPASEMTLTDEFGNPVQGDGEEFKQNVNGLTLRGGSKLIFNSDNKVNWHINFTYEFTKLEKPDEPVEDTKNNRNIHIIYPGVGLTWSFGN